MKYLKMNDEFDLIYPILCFIANLMAGNTKTSEVILFLLII